AINEPVELPNIVYNVASGQEIVIDEKTDPKLDVIIVAKEFTSLIDNLKENKGQMLGVFGRWGRGKTFLYNQIIGEIKNRYRDLDHNYYHLEFNAWKYQETETIWAHLYNEVLEAYLNEGNQGKWSRWKRFERTFSLNIKRKGYWSLIFLSLTFVVSLIVTFKIGNSYLQDLTYYLLTSVGLFGIKAFIKMYKKFYQPVKDTIKKYSEVHNYNNILGVQAEIQDELVILVKHWLGKYQKKESDKEKVEEQVNDKTKEENINKRLLLFVDDLDRCSEEKIVQIIDALRVMLDDQELVKRIIVLVAVDEQLLEMAIHHKYKEFDYEYADKKQRSELVSEYMDKLFIGGVKLPPLAKTERKVILENYAINNQILGEMVVSQGIELNIQNEEEEELEPENEELVFPESLKSDIRREQSSFFMLQKELDNLSENSKLLSEDVTPRQLRIYMYRYLLAKNILATVLKRDVGNQVV
ncbi:MAG: hypothetical protein HRT68_17135, partial [Flavobacteriaceae bacterium]|nr:hypothetical protein [Flavobacteriaceae bacterium]